MTQDEALLWKQEAAKGAWRLDSIHNTSSDCLLYRGADNGIYAHFYDGRLSIGTYQFGGFSMGDAAFRVQGRKPFASAKEAIAYLISKAGVRPTQQTIRELMLKGLL